MGTAEKRLALRGRVRSQRLENPLELGEQPVQAWLRAGACAAGALGEGRQREAGLIEATEAVGREVLQRGREGPEELSERRRRALTARGRDTPAAARP